MFREREWASDFRLCREPINMNSVLDLFSVSLSAKSLLRLSSTLPTLFGVVSHKTFSISSMCKRKKCGSSIVP